MRRYWPYVVGALLLALIIWFAAGLARGGDQDRLSDDQVAGGNTGEAETATSPEDRCASRATYDLIKRELFRQAANVRGSDAAAFDRLSAYAALRVEAPALQQQDEGLGMVSCSARAALDLPPGVSVVGGRRTLTANLSYSVQPAADGSGDVLTLRGAEGIVIPLATLAREGTQPQAPAPVTGEPSQGTADPLAAEPEPAPPPPAAPVPPRPVERAPSPPARPEAPRSETPRAQTPRAQAPQAASSRPSFNCARARTRGEIAVCRSPNLAALDREMASFYTRSYRGADPETRRLLERTRGRFLGYRDRCTSDACIADAYRGRITEIRDIVDGRWQGGR